MKVVDVKVHRSNLAPIDNQRLDRAGMSLVPGKEPGSVFTDPPRPKRSLENLGPELKSQPETNGPDAVILQR